MKLTFDPEQIQAIEHERGPMLVVAGAGTGKTLVLVERIARLIEKGIAKPDEILAVTYTDNAARELRERVAKRVNALAAAKIQACTFHAYCHRLLEREGRGFTPLGNEDLWVYLRRRISELPLRNFIRAANLGEFVHDLTEFFSRCHDQLIDPAKYEEFLQRVKAGEAQLPRVTKASAPPLSREEALERADEIGATFRKVEEMLAAEGLGTFGHQLVRGVQLLESSAALLEREQQHTRFILIDEFQDVNFAQIALMRLLAGAEQNVFAVGDPDQAIYKFRGASSAAFEEFLRIFPNSKGVRLRKNHRSTPAILDCAHALINANPELAAFERKKLESARAEVALNEGRHFESIAVEAIFAQPREQEAADIAGQIEKLRRGRGFHYRDCAVLYRQHTHRAELVREFSERDIPFAVTGLDAFMSPDVRDLLAALRLVVFPRENTALLRLASRPEFGLNPDDLRRQMKLHEKQLADVLQQSAGGKTLLSRLASLREELRGNGMRVDSAIRAAMRSLKLTSELSPVAALQKFATEWLAKPITRTGELHEFLEYLELFREARGTLPLDPSEADDAVQLMTAHSAKGLEFKHVFMIRANSPSFPCGHREPLFEFPQELRGSDVGEADSKTQHSQEERRLFFVAMTRAKDTLAMYGKPTGKEATPAGYLRELLRDRTLRESLHSRPAAALQLEIRAGADPQTPLAEWLSMPPLPTSALIELSPSSIERYSRCPLQFKIERDWSVPVKPTAALQFGSAMHTALKVFGDRAIGGGLATVEEMLAAFHDVFTRAEIEDPLQRQLYERQAAMQLEKFREANPSLPSVLGTERGFILNVGGVRVRGRIDRVDRIEGETVSIVDYKTGSPRSQEDADESLQLTVYALGARDELKLTPERLVFSNLETGAEVVTTRTMRQIEEAKQLITNVAANISVGNFEPKPGFHCRWCGYREICPTQEERLYSIAPAAVAARVN